MYPLLMLNLIAAPDLDRGAVNALLMNLPAATNFNYLPPTEPGDHNSRADVGEKTQIRFEGDVLIEGHVYSAALLEQFDGEHNLLWQTKCAYVTRVGSKEPGRFCICLARQPLREGEPVALGEVSVFPPKILTSIVEKCFVCPESNSGNFPEVVIGKECAQLDVALVNGLKRRVNLFAHVYEAGSEECSAGVSLDGEDIIEVRYPNAGIRREYQITHASISKGRNEKPTDLECMVLDIMRIVSEYHGEDNIPWERIFSNDRKKLEAAVGQDSYYCYMNDSMRELLRRSRKAKTLSQEALAKRVSTTGLVISRLERGEVTRVLRSLLEGIERELDLPAGTIASLQGTTVQAQKPTDESAEAKAAPSADGQDADTETPPQKSGFCRNCGKHLYADSHFCPACGKKVLP